MTKLEKQYVAELERAIALGAAMHEFAINEEAIAFSLAVAELYENPMFPKNLIPAPSPELVELLSKLT